MHYTLLQSTTLDIKDIELYLHKQYGLAIPSTTSATSDTTSNHSHTHSISQPLSRSLHKSRVLESHRRRLQMVQKSKMRQNMKHVHEASAKARSDAKAG